MTQLWSQTSTQITILWKIYSRKSQLPAIIWPRNEPVSGRSFPHLVVSAQVPDLFSQFACLSSLQVPTIHLHSTSGHTFIMYSESGFKYYTIVLMWYNTFTYNVDWLLCVLNLLLHGSITILLMGTGILAYLLLTRAYLQCSYIGASLSVCMQCSSSTKWILASHH